MCGLKKERGILCSLADMQFLPIRGALEGVCKVLL